jgi:hypothetical protein
MASHIQYERTHTDQRCGESLGCLDQNIMSLGKNGKLKPASTDGGQQR